MKTNSSPLFACALCIVCPLFLVSLANHACAQTTLTGYDLAMHSVGTNAGSSWTLDRNGYVGTYIHLNNPGDVTIGVQATGLADAGVNPHMNIVVADTRAGFDVAASPANYEHTFNLPAGTYFVRTEFNNDLALTPRQLSIDSLTVTGATVSNTGNSNMAVNNFNATDAANTYIKNFRRGDVSVALSGVAPGKTVDVSLKRIGFNFGTAIGGTSTNSVNTYLGNPTNNWRTSFQAHLNQNFNTIVLGNGGKWGSNEATRNAPTMGGVDAFLNYAAAHNMETRMHNLIWGDNSSNGQQPSWVLNNSATGLLDRAAAGDAAAAADLRNAISSRIDYYVGDGPAGNADRAARYQAIDVYNESYHTGEVAPISMPGYWNTYGVAGVADIYHEVKQAIADAGAQTKVFVNEYNVLGDPSYADYYIRHIESLRQAGFAAGQGEVVDGIGAQYYPNSIGSHSAAVFEANLQSLAVEGLPITLTEFGVAAGVNQLDSADILESTMRLAFGSPDTDGFLMWGFDAENGTGNLFAPAAALYNVSTNFGSTATWTITPAGQRYEWLFGYGPDPAHRGDNLDPWNTQLTTTVGPDGRINFNGFYGDYQLVVNDQTYNLSLTKGTQNYSLSIAPGDYNGDGQVDIADYTIWRDTLGSTDDMRADGNGNKVIDEGDYTIWKSLFGTTYASGTGATVVPEPTSSAMLAVGLMFIGVWRRSSTVSRWLSK